MKPWAPPRPSVVTPWSPGRSRCAASTTPTCSSALRTVPRHLFVPPAVEDRAYDDGALRDRLRPDDLAALHRGSHDALLGRSQSAQPRARGGQRLGLPDGHPRRAGRPRSTRSSAVASSRSAPVSCWPGWAITTSTTVLGDGSLGLPEERALRPDRGDGGGAAGRRRRCSSSSPRAAVWSCRCGPAGGDQVLVVVTRTAAGLHAVESIPCRFVPLVGESGYRDVEDEEPS